LFSFITFDDDDDDTEHITWLQSSYIIAYSFQKRVKILIVVFFRAVK